MKEQFVTYDIALKLKELGFDEQCLAVYINNKLTIEDDWLYSTNKDTFIESTNCTAPLWQQAFDWFRIKYNWLIVVDVASSNEYYVAVREFDEYGTTISKIPYKTYSIYNDAREQAILKAIELIKEC